MRTTMASIVLGCLLTAVPLGSAAAQTPSGSLPPDMAAWDEATKQQQREAGERLVKQIADAAASGVSELRIEPGHYRFAEPLPGNPKTHVRLQDISDLTIDFQGSTLWMETGQGALLIANCRNLTLRNVFIDWDPLPFTQGTIIAVNADDGSIDVRLDEGFERVTDGLANARGSVGGLRGLVFDPATREMKPGVTGFAINGFWDKRVADRTYRVGIRGFYSAKLTDIGFQRGDLIALLKRDGRAVRINGSESVTLEDFTLYASPFVCFNEAGGAGGHVYRRTNIVRRPGTARLLGGNADGINSTSVEKGPLIEDCRIEYLGDDFINIHSHYGRVISQEAPDRVLVTRLHNRPEPPAGTPLQFYTRTTVESLGERKIVSAESLQWKVDPTRTTADLSHRWRSGDAARLAEGQTVLATRLVLDGPIELPPDAMLISPGFVGAGAIIRDCDFRGSLGRGIRLQSPEALIENNTIANTAGHAISMASQPSFWGEGADVHHARIVNNTIIEADHGNRRGSERAAIIAMTSGDYAANPRQRDIAIVGNTIRGSSGAAIVARGIRDLEVRDNVIDGHHAMPPYPPTEDGERMVGLGHAIVVEAAPGAAVEGNRITGGGPHAKGDLHRAP